MDFLESGMPVETMKTTFTPRVHGEPTFKDLEDATETLHAMLGRLNVASYEFISSQYDHEVQGGSVLKPLQGAGKVNASAVAVKPVLSSEKAVVKSQGINPSYSDIDTYHMAACAIDTAVRAAVAAGAKLDRIALLDNFCWCSSNDPERLGQLKRATQACYDTAVAYETPFISGKDSMFNDFRGFDEKGNPVNISIPPTLLISSIAVVDDATKTVSLDAKVSGDLVYVLGETKDELGGSEYYAMMGEIDRGRAYIGNNVPRVDAGKNKGLYERLGQAIDNGLVASSQSVERAGLSVALAKTAMGGRKGMEIDLSEVRGNMRKDSTLFSESQGRIVVTVAPGDRERFEQTMAGSYFARIGYVREDSRFRISDSNGITIDTDINKMLQPYKETYKEL
jgi:phosphoribosylformylglycinamidine (FGAM) synthase-like enzyme